MKFISKNAVSVLLGSPGAYATRIVEIAEDLASQKEEYNDRTPQLKVTFATAEEKKISAWLNLKGFKTFHKVKDSDQEGLDCLTAEERKSGKYRQSSDGYAVEVKSGMRAESARKTEAAHSIIAKLGNDAGIPEDKEFGVEDLLGKPIGIQLEFNAQAQIRVRYTMPIGQVAKKQEAAA